MTFTLNKKEELAAKKFIKSLKRSKIEKEIWGSRVSYTFTPTGIGVAVTVRDCITGETKDITDYDSW